MSRLFSVSFDGSSAVPLLEDGEVIAFSSDSIVALNVIESATLLYVESQHLGADTRRDKESDSRCGVELARRKARKA